MITFSELKYLLEYKPLSGYFIWRVSRGTRARAGQIAGAKDPQGYIVIGINKRQYLAHRLAYFYQIGSWPPLEMDHINQNKSDNRWVNLRLATSAQNKVNRKKFRGSLLKGVSRNGVGFSAWASVNKKRIWLGYFPTENLAHAAHCEASQKEFGAYHRAE
jgi:hypothetical protein